jgi:DNA-binding MarR family transcriptional regulator
VISEWEKGQELFAEHHQYHLRLTEEITATLSQEEQTLFSGVLEKIIGQMLKKGGNQRFRAKRRG